VVACARRRIGRSKVISYSLAGRAGQHFINWAAGSRSPTSRPAWSFRSHGRFQGDVDLWSRWPVYNPFDFFLSRAPRNSLRVRAGRGAGAGALPGGEPLTPLVQAYLEKIDRKPQRTIDFLVALNQQLQHDVKYLIRMEPGVQTPEQTLHQRQRLLPRLGLAAGAVAAPHGLAAASSPAT
jgi:transglutaminase-like putative cysteine protease